MVTEPTEDSRAVSTRAMKSLMSRQQQLSSGNQGAQEVVVGLEVSVVDLKLRAA